MSYENTLSRNQFIPDVETNLTKVFTLYNISDLRKVGWTNLTRWIMIVVRDNLDHYVWQMPAEPMGPDFTFTGELYSATTDYLT